MINPSIVKVSVNDKDAKDSYNISISGSTFDLVDLLFKLEDEEHQYLLEALDQARSLQRESGDPTEDLLASLLAEMTPEEENEGE